MIPKMILGIIVLDREDKMLLLQHRNGDHWSFCKGHKEDTDTSDIHTAARELFEETKLRVPSLWMESESWEEYCTRCYREFFNDRTSNEEENYIDRITPSDPRTRPRMFREEYRFRKHNREVVKRVDFYVARIRDPAALQTQTEEILNFCWLSLDLVEDQLNYAEDRELFNRVKQAISK
ncbi:NUDIX domain-containing protein [Phytophthora cinnamomi]|uniref:NUDIX domain-containing protein n=1 Tax=Phytophthora cinnamomi TaxID=4785 RepID=UPI00355A216F|nr:NUDIX domain-containing protein [Phytophthora cinnamomi]